jgi:hypothetical protein
MQSARYGNAMKDFAKYVMIFLLGAGFAHEIKPKHTKLYGGVITSSELATVYGYADDSAGCRQIAACLNFAQSKRLLTDAFSAKWGNRGNHFCRK